MVEHLLCKQGVKSSNLFISTSRPASRRAFLCLVLYGKSGAREVDLVKKTKKNRSSGWSTCIGCASLGIRTLDPLIKSQLLYQLS